MDGGTELYTIGQLARRTGLQARTIRFWSDSGVVPPAGRSPGGYRLYDVEAVARLDLVRTLRELGLGLEAVQQVVSRQTTLVDVAKVHIEALDAEIRTLRLRRAILRAVTRRGITEGEMTLMHKLARLSARERQQIIDDFVDRAFAGVEDQDAAVVAGWMRELPPTLPDDPTSDQVDAWMELAELVADEDFQQTVRRLVLSGEVDNRLEFGLNIRPAVLEHAGRAVDEAIVPESPEGKRILGQIVPADLVEEEVADLLKWLETVAEPRVERYWELLSLINGQTPPPAAVPAFTWLIAAMRAHR
ncbi:DNA-binding transcriptional MerR regulator [Micromonospora pisi]|uniref:DNA-binding transcriptional MerR regulator n=1 Tax=Micromonospora pisi TaxID=589240 RepID=A0A495JSG4_9ACTN|nr:MerR family transcriptional regulator [Micromonospora pisi]RKR91926.1 DNA-binding transcriptional MerR regulator [Micromonospora pisi]